MRLPLALPLLFLAALMEAAGDALIRSGLHAGPVARAMFFAGGTVVLFGYGCVVNSPAWDFGRLLGIYVVFFFVVAQLISWVFFHHRPGGSILLGGAFIVVGGLIISLA